MGKSSWVRGMEVTNIAKGLGMAADDRNGLGMAADDRNWCAAESPVEQSALSTSTGDESCYRRLFDLRVPNYFVPQYPEVQRRFLVLKGDTNRPNITVPVHNGWRRKVSEAGNEMMESGCNRNSVFRKAPAGHFLSSEMMRKRTEQRSVG